MQTKSQKIVIGIFLAWMILIVPAFYFSSGTAEADFTYQPMERIPGFETDTGKTKPDLKVWIESTYKFFMWAVGICALFMITIGGFTYMTSAGNTSKAGTGKQIITDAIIGLILALVAVLLFTVINPNITKVNVTINPASTSTSTTGKTGTTTTTCSAVSSGPCSVANLGSTCFGSNSSKASGICGKESAGDPSISSGVDKCTVDGKPVSFGLFQINISAHSLDGLDCPSAFSKTYTSSVHDCEVTNQSLYDQCVAKAKTPSTNIAKACEISNNGQSWGQWGANSQCKY